MPTIFKSTELRERQVIESTIIQPSIYAQMNTIYDLQCKYSQQKRPVLIIFRNNEELDQYRLHIIKKNIQGAQQPQPQLSSQQVSCDVSEPIIINQETKNLKSVIEQAMHYGQITYMVREFGRGTDFLCLDENINAAGGVVVIQAYCSNNQCEEDQNKGRCGRQGSLGEFVVVTYVDDVNEALNVKISIGDVDAQADK